METQSDAVGELRTRIVALEKKNLRLRWITIILFAMIVVVYAEGNLGTSSTIKTHSLIITDPQGKERAIINCADKGVGLVFLGANGKVQIGVNAGSDGYSSFSLNDGNGSLKAMLGTNPDSSTYLIVKGNSQQATSCLFAANGDSATMTLRRADNVLALHTP